jgi:DNA end-binding protein Ku
MHHLAEAWGLLRVEAEDVVPRSMWKGAISFGLVTVPVELQTAVRSHRPRFRLLHAKDKSPVEYQRVCRRDGKPVAWEDLVKGYEYEPGHFVVLTKDDFETAALEKSRRIDILDFVEASEIDERFFDVPYYVTPGKGGERAYAVLREALRESGKVGVGRVILRQVQHLAAVTVVDEALVLNLMRFADELVDESTFSLPGRKVDSRELGLAQQLIGGLTATWEPEKYKDDYRDNLMKVIKNRMSGRKAKLVEQEIEPSGKVLDLMERLRASLEQGGAKSRGGTSAKSAAKRPAKKTASPSKRKRKAA